MTSPECPRCGRLQAACDLDPCSLNPVTGHVREATSLTDFLDDYPDGFMLGDCSCGATYMVPAGPDEYGALEAAHKKHVQEVGRRPMSHSWQLEIPNVRINAQHPATCVVTLSPVERLLLDSNPLLKPGLISLYREAIERGDYRTYGFSGENKHHVKAV